MIVWENTCERDEEHKVVCESVGIAEESDGDNDNEAEISCSEPTIR